MKMCRWACGVTRIDRVRNEDIRENGSNKHWSEVQRNRTEMVLRCEKESCVGRRMLSMVPPGMRGKEHPRQCWMDTTNAEMRFVGSRKEYTQERGI